MAPSHCETAVVAGGDAVEARLAWPCAGVRHAVSFGATDGLSDQEDPAPSFASGDRPSSGGEATAFLTFLLRMQRDRMSE
ncbi:MAG: hypothetical protein CFE44_09165 [Burkholderiales bacterium PBB4]|nr:MAG: hypothetical protein CFE44_09165 [Burkholderiales bacterium PBB4]